MVSPEDPDAPDGSETASVHASTIRNRAFRADQDDVAVGVGKPECQTFAHELADLLRWEIDDAGDLPISSSRV